VLILAPRTTAHDAARSLLRSRAAAYWLSIDGTDRRTYGQTDTVPLHRRSALLALGNASKKVHSRKS